MAYALAMLLSLWPGQAQAQGEKSYQYPPFNECGMVTRYNRGRIPANCLTEALNVLFGDDGTVSRRNGFTKYNQTACTGTKKIRGLWNFEATDGTRYLIINSSTSLFYAAADGTCTAIGNITLSDDDELDCVATLGRIWCTNSVDTGISWDGSSTMAVAGMPLGSLIGAFRNRVLVADIVGSFTRLRLSGESNGLDWTVQVPGVSTTPANIDIAGTHDGMRVKCLLGEYQNSYIIGRERDLWALGGNSRDDFTLRKISSEVGCIDDRTVQESSNGLIWLSRRGLERMVGPNIQRISDPIRSDIDVIIEATQDTRSAVDTTQADFQAGNLSAAGPNSALSATFVAGSLTPSVTTFSNSTGDQFGAGTLTNGSTSVYSGFFTVSRSSSMGLLDDFADGDQTSNPAWTAGYEQSANTTINVTSNKAHFERTNTAISGNHNYATRISTPNSAIGTWSIQVAWDSVSANVGHLRYFFMSSANDWDSSTNDGYMLEIRPQDTADLNLRFIALYRVDNGALTRIGSQNVNADEIGAVIVNVTRSTAGVFTVVSSTVSSLDSSWVVNFSVTDTTYDGGTALFIHHRGYFNYTNSTNQGYWDVDNFFMPGPFSDTVARIESSIFDTGITTPVSGRFTATFSTPAAGTSVNFQVHSATSANGVWNAWSDVSTQSYPTAALTRRYIQYASSVTAFSTATAIVESVSLSLASTGQFYSQCRNPGTGITGWRRIECDLTNYQSTWQLQIATGATCDAVGRSSAPWTTQTNNQIVSVPVAPFFAWRANLTSTHHVSTGVPNIEECSVEWVEGAARPPSASAVYKDNYMLFYTTNTAVGARNDSVLNYDQNAKWSKLSGINAYSAVVYEADLLTGDSADSGRIYTQDITDSDDGSDYTIRIKTADNDMGSPTRNKVFKYAYITLQSEDEDSDSISLAANYYIDGSTTAVSMGNIDLGESEPGGIFNAKLPFPIGSRNTGHRLALELSYTGSQGPVKILGGSVVYNELDED